MSKTDLRITIEGGSSVPAQDIAGKIEEGLRQLGYGDIRIKGLKVETQALAWDGMTMDETAEIVVKVEL